MPTSEPPTPTPVPPTPTSEPPTPTPVPTEPAKKALEQVVQGPFATLPDTPPVPEDNPQTEAKVELGKMLYFDPRLSKSGIISCNTCHNLALGGDDGVPAALGQEFKTGGRNSPTVLNALFFSMFFWDGRAPSLEEQAKGPIQAPVEMAMPAEEAVERIRAIAGYRPYFEAAFPGEEEEPITFDNIVKAIAAFERTLITPHDGLDRYLRGDESALSEEAKRGMKLFQEVGCVACHNGPLLSLGTLMKFEYGDDPGRMKVTGNEADDHLFRVPTLRNISLTAPYFHDGSVATLDEAVRIMAQIELNRELADDEVSAIVAFLESLVGEQPQIVYPVLPSE
ncbi:MAG TPA: cytochrome-c peroxidase [Anaerolineae bacterium]|nr:cytochrome-c peroxidase [Anaerolineae bacterium]